MLLKELLVSSNQFNTAELTIPEIEISGISFDSRKVKPGDIFFALEGESADGHQFIPQAVNAGASAIVGKLPIKDSDAPYFQTENPRRCMAYIAAAFNGFPARSLTIIGVTGTDGKTTTVNLIFQILLAHGIKAGMISTVNAVIDNETIDTGFHVTTPESPVIQMLLRKMVDSGITHVVLEATSHGLDQYRVEACEFDIGVITNITHEHLDYHGSYEDYFNAKLKLIDYLMLTIKKTSGSIRSVVFNYDDISYERILQRIETPYYSDLKKIRYGLKRGLDVFTEDIHMDADGLKFEMNVASAKRKVFSPLIGEYNIHNILAAIAATVDGLGLKIERSIVGVANMSAVPGRMERIDLGQDFISIVDFAHTPNALRVALETARKLTKGKVFAVFGSAGLRDRQKRRLMAAVSLDLADLSILTAEDPRTEDLNAILAEMTDEVKNRGGVIGKDYLVIADRGAAIAEAVKIAKTGDLVIACGKGHEQSMCFGEIEYPWDDRIAMRSALADHLGVNGPKMPILPTSNKKNQ